MHRGMDSPKVEISAQPRSSAELRKIATASFVGTVIEYYDFLIYGYAASLVFGKVFFPALGQSASTIASFATLGVAFVARPIGGVVFGHLGDRLGRKRALTLTLFLMGAATFLVGILPTADQIGAFAPVLLVVLRIIQGVAAGGEWSGAALFVAESAPKRRRGFWASAASSGTPVAVVLAAGTFLIVHSWVGDDAFEAYGWRIPFVASAVLIVIGLWIRMRTEETVAFQLMQESDSPVRAPILEAFRMAWRRMLLAAGLATTGSAMVYVGISYLTNYGAQTLGYGSKAVLIASVFGGIGLAVGTIIGAVASDTVGRRLVIVMSIIGSMIWSPLIFVIADRTGTVVFAIVVAVSTMLAGLTFGPMGAYLSELFGTQYRYSAVSFSYNGANVIGGAVTPLVGVAVTAAASGLVFGCMLIGLCVISLVCALALPETLSRQDL